MQDFANYRPSTDLGPSRAFAADWSPDIHSLIFGVLLGVAACLVGLKVLQAKADQAVLIEAPIIIEEVAKKPVKLDFYEALKTYKVLPRTYDQLRSLKKGVHYALSCPEHFANYGIFTIW